MIKFNKVRLKEIAHSLTGPFGSQLHESDYVEVGTPIVTVEHLGIESFSRQNLPYVSDEDKNRLKKYILKKGDIVFSRVGSIDRCTYVSENEDGWMFSGRCIRVRANDKVNSKFLAFYFNQEYFKKMMRHISVGATMPSLNTKLMDNIPIYLPPKQKQDIIAKTLGNINKKIELNNKINAELESMAKLIYDYWFVQFDFPDEKGKPYKSSGGKMVWNEELKREIPAGWEVSKLGKHFKLKRGISYKASEINGDGVPMINLNSFNLNGTYKQDGIKIYSGKYTDNKVAKPGNLLIACTDVTRNADIIGKAIIVPDYYIDDLVYSMDIACISPQNTLTESYLAMLFNSEHYHNYIKHFASGTLILHLNLDGIEWYKTVIPPISLLKKYDTLYFYTHKKICKNHSENKILIELRDWLLPMLMNGQVTIKEIEEKINQLGKVAEPLESYGKKK